MFPRAALILAGIAVSVAFAVTYFERSRSQATRNEVITLVCVQNQAILEYLIPLSTELPKGTPKIRVKKVRKLINDLQSVNCHKLLKEVGIENPRN